MPTASPAEFSANLHPLALWEPMCAVKSSTKNKLYEKTTIIDHIGDPDVAKIVGDYIKCSNIVEEEIVTDEDRSESEANVDFTIILGDDFDGRFVR